MKLRQALNQNGSTNQIISGALKRQKSINNIPGKDKAFLPYVKRLTERIGGILRKHDITPTFKIKNTVASSLLSPVKYKQDKLLVKGIYHIPCECGKVCENPCKKTRTFKQINMSAIAEHAMETYHKIDLEDTKVLVRENSFWARKIREAIEIRKSPENFNRDAGYDLRSLSW